MLFFGILMIIFLIGIYPFWDKKYTEKLKITLNENDGISYFKYVIYSEWTVTLLILAMFYFTSTNFAQIGFILPTKNSTQFLGIFTGFIIGVIILTFVLIKVPLYQRYLKAQTGTITYLVPTGKLDKKYAILSAFTAGICEEIIYRGFLLHLLSNSPFQLEGMMLLIIGAVIFGIAHYYQGWKGVLLAGLAGYALSKIYFQTNSLILPIVLHIIIDLRFVLTTNNDSNTKNNLNTSM